jgi:hypothetical protein
LSNREDCEIWKDPIVEEIHAVREEIARRFDYDWSRFYAHLREEQAKHPERVIGKEEFERRRRAARAETWPREEVIA